MSGAEHVTSATLRSAAGYPNVSGSILARAADALEAAEAEAACLRADIHLLTAKRRYIAVRLRAAEEDAAEGRRLALEFDAAGVRIVPLPPSYQALREWAEARP